MDCRERLEFALEELKKLGVDKCQCRSIESEISELNIAHGEITLLRTNFDKKIYMSIIKDQRKAELVINSLSDDEMKKSFEDLLVMAEQAEEDPNFDIADHQDSQSFTSGDKDVDLDRMYEVTKNVSEYIAKKYPKLNVEEAIMEFSKVKQNTINSNGLDLTEENSNYEFSLVFTSKDGEKTSSFNYTNIAMDKLQKELSDYECIDRLLSQSIQQLDAEPLEGKFKGKVIVTPECMGSFLYSYIYTFLSDMPIITKQSRLIDKLNEKVTDSKFTLKLCPVGENVAKKAFITSDGFKADNMTVIENGVLKNFMLSQYAAKKSGFDRAITDSNNIFIETGDKSFEDMIKDIDRGILLCRFSGGSPSSNGDFSGVAKNSFYIENGKIVKPIKEVMISGNLIDAFNNIQDISKESVNDGSTDLPWMTINDINISGK